MSENSPPTSDEKLEAAFEELETAETRPPQSSGTGGIGSLLAILLSLIAIGIASYSAYELFRLEADNESAQRIVELQTSIDAAEQRLGARVQQQAAKLADLEGKEGVSQASLDALAEKFAGDLSEIRARLSTSSEDWLYAEVEYLVRMANQRVLMEKDPESALQLLVSADRIIRDARGIAAHELRTALANDIAELQAVPTPDIQGVYLEISAQIRQVSVLQRQLPAYEAPAPVEAEEVVEQGWLGQAAAIAGGALARLSQLIDFRRGGVEVKPILPPEQEYYLRQNLILKLQVAQMALLEGESEVYRAALGEARGWIETQFDQNAAAIAMIDVLSRLAALEVTVAQPDISSSLDAARALLADFHRSDAE